MARPNKHNWSVVDQKIRLAVSTMPYNIHYALEKVSLETGIPFTTIIDRWYKVLRNQTREDSGKVFFTVGRSKALTNTKIIPRIGESNNIDIGVTKARNEGRLKGILIGLFQTVLRWL